MSFAHEFFKEDKYNYGDLEDKIGFVLDNYYDGMKIYRTIKNQNIQTLQKQEDAHNELQKLREKEEQLQLSGASLKDNERKELEDRKTYLEKLREEGDEVMMDENVLKTDQLVNYVIENMWFYELFNKLEMKLRPSIGKVASKAINGIFWPIKKMSIIVSKNTDSQFASDALNTAHKFLNNLPNQISMKINDI